MVHLRVISSVGTREGPRQFLKDNPAITEEIENKVKGRVRLTGFRRPVRENGEAAAAAAVSEASAAADVQPQDSKAAAACQNDPCQGRHS